MNTMNKTFLIAILLLTTQSATADSIHGSNHNVNKHAPIGVMGDHTHTQQLWTKSP